MKVRDIRPKRNILERNFKELQKLEKTLDNNDELVKRIQKEYGAEVPLNDLITTVRMQYYELLSDIDKRIDNAELDD